MTSGRAHSLRLPASWLLLLALSAWACWPGLYGPTLLDDEVNLRPLKQLELSEDFATDVVRGNRSGLGRPVSMASFTVERLYFDRGTYGQKQIGLLIHLLNATLVLLLARSLMRAARQPHAEQCALLIAGLWLTLPLLLSTTLYIVQRMTLLSATFSLIAMLCYCRGRLRLSHKSLGWFAASAFSVLLAVLAKENGVLAVPMIVVIEAFVFGFRDDQGRRSPGLLWVHGALVVVPVLSLLLLLIGAQEFLLGGYGNRSFTLGERLLTQPRVLLDYISQILWVDVQRLGLYHDDFPVSSSLFSPPATAAALAFWLVAAGAVLAAAIIGRFRLLAFGLAFFMAGHVMESTFIPLEIYFEHRNYLPAFGILFSLVAVANQVQSRVPLLRGWLVLAAMLLLGRNLVSLGSQAVVWSDVHTVNMEAVNHHPQSERALLALAEVYSQEGYVTAALPLMERANAIAGREGASAEVLEAIFYCLAREPLPSDIFSANRLTDQQIAESYFGDHVYHLSRSVIDGRCPSGSGRLFADKMAEWLQGEGDELRATPQIYGSLLLLENELERYDSALGYAEILTRKNPEDVMGLQFTLYLSHVLELPERGEAARSKLLELKERGRLSRQEAANLELFSATP